MHPEYDPATKKNNVAILKLEWPATFNDRVNSACLPEPNEVPSIGESCVMMGWGKNARKLKKICLNFDLNSDLNLI